MTDTATAESNVGIQPPMGNVEALVQMYELVFGQIKAIDDQLDAATGGKAAGRRAIINSLKKDHEDEIGNVLGQLFTGIFEDESLSDEQKAALYFGIVEGLKTKYEEIASKTVEPMVEKVPETPPIPAEEIEKLSASRSNAYKQAKYVRELLSMFGEDIEEKFPMPKRRGGGGKRGVRAISLYSWTLDGDRMPADQDSLTAISKRLGFEKSKVLRDLMREADIDLSDPVDPIEFTLAADKAPDGNSHSIVGNKRAEDDEADDEDENGEDEDAE